MKKCELFIPGIKYLGQITNKNTRRPDPRKIIALEYMPAPTDTATSSHMIGNGLIVFNKTYLISPSDFNDAITILLGYDFNIEYLP